MTWVNVIDINQCQYQTSEFWLQQEPSLTITGVSAIGIFLSIHLPSSCGPNGKSDSANPIAAGEAPMDPQKLL
jgi:hypothetical protein